MFFYTPPTETRPSWINSSVNLDPLDPFTSSQGYDWMVNKQSAKTTAA